MFTPRKKILDALETVLSEGSGVTVLRNPLRQIPEGVRECVACFVSGEDFKYPGGNRSMVPREKFYREMVLSVRILIQASDDHYEDRFEEICRRCELAIGSRLPDASFQAFDMDYDGSGAEVVAMGTYTLSITADENMES